jgi:hypothetical protein
VIVVTTVVVILVVDPPGLMLVSVVRALEVDGMAGCPPDGALKMVVDMLVKTVVPPPGSEFVITTRTSEVVSWTEEPELPGRAAPIVVAVTIVIVVVCPPGMMLVNVVKTLEVTGTSGLPGTPEGGKDGADGINGGEATMLLLTGAGAPGGLTGCPGMILDAADALGGNPIVGFEVGITGVGHGRRGSPTGTRELEGDGAMIGDGAEKADVDCGNGSGPIPGRLLVTTVVINAVPEGKVVVNVVTTIGGAGAGGGIPEVGGAFGGAVEGAGMTSSDEMTGVISAVLVTRVLNRLGGAMLFIHSVVPFTTEK